DRRVVTDLLHLDQHEHDYRTHVRHFPPREACQKDRHPLFETEERMHGLAPRSLQLQTHQDPLCPPRRAG
ncbi:hypothetical protein, partial [Winogradskya consettensis]|uniref:hypothetical protein n=1 Tax=Winogradskya consettensis TaxID=113560 RepID=UPI001BB37662